MANEQTEKPQRRPREKREARTDISKKLVVRLTDEQWNWLKIEAGDIGASTHVRNQLFSEGVPNRDGLRRIAALHVLGRRVQLLAEQPAADPAAIADALADVRAAIARLSTRQARADAKRPAA